MDRFYRWVYNRNKHKFNELLVEDMFLKIPKDIQEPALDFLAGGKEKLELFFNLYAYKIQRRGIADLKKADVYLGMLIMTKALLSAISDAKKEVRPQKRTEDIPTFDPLKNVDDFLKRGKEILGGK